MIRSREDIEKTEIKTLAPYAVYSMDSQGRKYPEDEANDRTCFQRDRHRIIYSKAFMRLKGKTQVVLAGHGDHFRTRITHTQYVATVSRDLARTLGLNEDLAEAIAMAHDLGHTCFGHEGQDALNEIMQAYGSRFEHNEQSLRIVEALEKKSLHYPGLNLSFEVRDGIDKHRTVYDNPKSSNAVMPSLEAQVVNLADEIAYKYHDLDDALRAGVITEGDLEGLFLWRRAKALMEEQDSDLTWNVRSKVMQIMIYDLVRYTDAAISEAGIKSVQDVYKTGRMLVAFSDEMRREVDEMGDFLFCRFYKSEPVSFKNLYDHPERMPEEFIDRLEKEEQHIVVKDYVAGMTDHYAMSLYNQLNI
jgi:dGTPase